MHNLLLSEDQALVVDSVRKFVAEVVAPAALERDEHRELALDEFRGIAELGVFGIAVGEAAGGAAMGYLPLVAALESVGAHSSALARLVVGQLQCTVALEAVGHPSLAGMVAGSDCAVFLGPEHGLRLAGTALHGAAELVPGGVPASQFVAAATDGGEPVLVLVDANVTTRMPLRSLGLASSGPARVHFAGCKAEVVVRGADAAAAVDRARLAGWLGVAATCCGGGAEAVQLGRRHAGQRIAFGKPLLAQEAVLRKLGEAQRAVDGARHLTWHAARLADLGQDAAATALQARIAAVDAMVLAADESIQIHGGFGYTVEYHVERHYRDAKTLEVLDGGSERLRDQLAIRQFA